MPTKRNIKKLRKSRKTKIRGGTATFQEFFEQFMNAENQETINALASNPNNFKHINYLFNLCFLQMFIANHPNEQPEVSRLKTLFNIDNVVFIENPINIIIKLFKAPLAPLGHRDVATNARVLTILYIYGIDTNTFFREIALFMHNTNNINTEIIDKFIGFEPTFFINYFREKFLTTPPSIIKIILEMYAKQSGVIGVTRAIKVILFAYNNTHETNAILPFDFYFSLLARLEDDDVFLNAVDMLDLNHFEQLFNALEPHIEMPLTKFNNLTMLDRAVAFRHNDIAMFLIDRGAIVSEFAVTRLLVQENASLELLKYVLTHGAVIPETANALMRVSPRGANRDIKIEIINNWKKMMLLYGLEHSNEGQRALAYGLEDLNNFLS